MDLFHNISSTSNLCFVYNNIKYKSYYSIDEIKRRICEYYNVSQNIFEQKTRKREKIEITQVAHKIACEKTKLSQSKIGAAIGAKDRTTVIHSCKQVSNLCETDKFFKAKYEEILKLFN